MGFFFTTEPVKPAVAAAIEEAINTNPATVPDPKGTAAAKANEVSARVAGEFSWVRMAVAVGLLVGVFIACIYAGTDARLEKLYDQLLHAFELLLGAVIGLITGEAISKR